ncbi:MoxR family ATPase [uncultured Alteromonas sp.]|jgi:cobaltochelatase CobS|uniref:MoxR family ATPase n=1 Tax=uncultured Alteromonas sp. TaxID=179113 RepID=UPI0030D584FC|tara:strand:- start:23355 stop:24395 length:1041 start_codon:yes stop_codon:yes gene_type:complete
MTTAQSLPVTPSAAVQPTAVQPAKIGVAPVDANTIFPKAPQDLKVLTYKAMGEFSEKIPAPLNYIPNMDVFEVVLSWFSNRAVQPLWLHGPTGSGKSELLLFMANKLGVPVSIISGSLDTRGETLFVRTESRGEDGGTTLVQVPTDIIKRYRDGGLIIIDEIDKFDSPVQSALHPLCDYKELYVEGIGLIKPHKFTKVAATANTVGEGGSMHYTNSVVVDAALRSRFCFIELPYPPAQLEFDIVSSHFPALDGELIKSLIKVGDHVRKAFDGGALTMPFSTRTIVSWCHSMKIMRTKSLRSSFQFSYASSLPSDERLAAEDLLHAELDEDIDLPLPDLIKSLHQSN